MLVDLSCGWNFQKFAFVRASFKLPIQWLTYNVITGAYLPSKLRVKYCVIGKRYRCLMQPRRESQSSACRVYK